MKQLQFGEDTDLHFYCFHANETRLPRVHSKSTGNYKPNISMNNGWNTKQPTSGFITYAVLPLTERHGITLQYIPFFNIYIILQWLLFYSIRFLMLVNTNINLSIVQFHNIILYSSIDLKRNVIYRLYSYHVGVCIWCVSICLFPL